MSKNDLLFVKTTRESIVSPTSDTMSPVSPVWARPKSPLPPHRLAKLANALGVSTPMPAVHSYASPTSPSFNQNSLAAPDFLRRSPSPSATSTFSSYQPSTSKFLLHVIPPLHLPHDSDTLDSVLTPPPPSASGYHTQFRRGTLVPVHSTLQSQLIAIAKEYALPSTTGLVLYLVSNPKSPQSASDETPDEPGPRLSEDIWKHLWTRVWKAEREEGMNGLIGLGLGIGTQSTPHLPQDGSSSSSQLRSFLSSSGNDSTSAFPYPSPSSPSSVSDTRSNSKSTATSNSPIDTPDTSVPDELARANSLDLPGLDSPAIIPILAKVEFDIDKKKAGWYGPWMRSRTLNHAKRIQNRKPSADDTSESGDSSDRKAPVMLRLRAQTASPVSLLSSSTDEIHPADELNAEYARLQDEQDEQESEEDSNNDDDDETARVASTGKDPLADVFGNDADTWADIRDLADAKRISDDPNVVNLALTGEDLVNLPEPGEDEERMPDNNELDEVKEIMDQMSHRSQESSGGIHRPHVPPPLVLHPPNAIGNELEIPSPGGDAASTSSSSRGSTYLPYLKGSPAPSPSLSPSSETANGAHELDNDDEDGTKPKRSPQESEKRVGGVFDDLDLGLEPSITEDFDDNEIPNDHRKSQYILKAQLDEIERNLNQLSPRVLKIDLEEEQEQEQSFVSLNSPFLDVPIKKNSDVFPPTPKNATFGIGSGTNSDGAPRQWPAVPYSQLNEEAMPGSSSIPSVAGSSSTSTSSSSPPLSPPRLAVNGVSTFAPKAFINKSNGEVSAETKQRRKALEEELNYPPLNLRNDKSESPIIPLSPDPFGRYPSTPEPSHSRSGSRQSGSVYWESVPAGISVDSLKTKHSVKETEIVPRTSRFSTDSVKEEVEDKKPNNRATILSTKSIRKLWRRSNNKSMSNISTEKPPPPPPPKTSMDSLNPPTPHPQSGRSSPTGIPMRPPRPSEEDMDIPDIPEQMAIPLHPGSGRPVPMPIIAAQMQQNRSKSALDHFYFDQESPYPTTRRSPMPPVSKEPFVPGDSHRTSVRKSILKWKAAAAIDGAKGDPPVDANGGTAVGATVRPERTTSAARPRRPSVLSFGQSRHSQTSPPSSIPPSPQIPEQFLKNGTVNGNVNGQHLRTGSHQTHLTSSSMDSRVDSLASSTPRAQSVSTVRSSSPSQSMGSAKSRTSEEGSDARPSIDESQFEIVSPRSGTLQLSYPYHGLDVPT